MSEETVKSTLLNFVKSLLSSIKSRFNITNSSFGYSKENTTNVHYILPMIKDEKNSKEVIVIANDQKIIENIWKYLNREDKINCTMVCKRFNKIVSDMNCFHLVVRLPTRFRIIPRLSRQYETVTFQRYKCNKLQPLMHQMLKHLGQTVTELSFYDCVFNLTTFYEFLR